MNKRQRLAWLPQVVIDDLKAACDSILDHSVVIELEDLVQLFQQANGLVVDGWPGRKTAQALYGSEISIARNRRELRKQVGMEGARWKRVDPDGRRVTWKDRHPDVIRVDLHNGDFARVHNKFAEEFSQIFKVACLASGYTPAQVQSYNPRTIGLTGRLSMHAFGVAVDFDPDLNPWGGIIKKGPLKGEPSKLRQNMKFVEVFEWVGWQWGGRWDGNAGDDMHFQRKG